MTDGNRALAVGPLLALLAGCGGETGGRIEAPAPPRELAEGGGAGADSMAPMQPGMIVAPLSVDLASGLAALEGIVPARLGDLEKRLPLPLQGSRQASFAFEVRREPFEVSFAADTILFSAILHYRGRAWFATSIKELNGACGIDDEPPRARLVLGVIPRLTERWQIRLRTQVTHLAALTTTKRDRCQVTFLRLNVTEKVLQAAREALEDRLPRIQERIAAIDVKTPLEHIWMELQKPIHLGDSLWLLLQPASVHLGPIRGSRRTVNATLGVTATPRIVTGPRPVLESIALPPLGSADLETGFLLPVEGALDYEVMSARLSRQLKGRSVKAAGGEFRIRSVTGYGIGGGRLALGLEFEGSAEGHIWLIGTPSYDAATGMIRVPDLDFDASSAGLLVQGVAWIKGGAIRDFLREQAQISAGELLRRLQDLAVKQMNRSLAPGVELKAVIGTSEPAGLIVGPRALIVRARAIGSVQLVIGKELLEANSPERPAAPASARR